MNLEEFIQLFAEQFDETPIEQFKPNTEYRKLEEWGSLVALSIISAVDEEMDKQLTGTELRNTDTIENLYKLLESK